MASRVLVSRLIGPHTRAMPRRAQFRAWVWPAAMATFLVSSCTGQPAPALQPPSASSTGASGSALPTSSGNAASAPSVETPPQPLTAASIVQVVADGLQLRSAAGTQAPTVGGLERGAVARIESDPVEADGFVWYEVVDLDSNRGWVASGDDEDAWLATVADQPDSSALLRFEQRCDVPAPLSLPTVTVMDDRRVVMGDFEGRWKLGHLTDAGFDRLSEAVLSSPYLLASAEYELVVRAGAEPPGHGLCVYTFTVGTTAEPIVVRSAQWLGEEEVFYEPSPERRALDGMAHGLQRFEEALGQDAWEAEPLPYIGTSFTVELGAGEGPLPPGTARVDASALPVGTSLGDIGEPPPGGMCGELTITEAFELARVLRDAGVDLAIDTFSYASFVTDAGWVSMTLAPQAPDGYPGCADAGF